jgi:hypothetical protein
MLSGNLPQPKKRPPSERSILIDYGWSPEQKEHPLNDGPSSPAFAVTHTIAGIRKKLNQTSNAAIDADAEALAV